MSAVGPFDSGLGCSRFFVQPYDLQEVQIRVLLGLYGYGVFVIDASV